MRIIKCDRCGYNYTDDDLENRRSEIIEVDKVGICFIIASGQHEREENQIQIDLCKACRSNLPYLYKEITDIVTNKITEWLNLEKQK
jgi:hypothetical protein